MSFSSKLSRLMATGQSPNLGVRENRQIFLTNVLAVGTACLVLPYFAIFGAVGLTLLAGLTPLIVLYYLFVPLSANRRGRHKLAKLSLIFAATPIIGFYAIALHSDVGVQFMFFPLIGLPLLLFSPKETRELAVSLVLPTAALGAVYWYSANHPAMYPIPSAAQEGLFYALLYTGLLLNFLVLLSFYISHSRSEEHLVSSRRVLRERNAGLRLIMDHVREGLVTLRDDGTLHPERSASCEEWLGPWDDSTPLWHILAPHDAAWAEAFELGFEQYVSGILPSKAALAQLPTRLRIGESLLHFRYEEIEDGERVSGLLIIMRDVSDEDARANQESERFDALALFELLASDRASAHHYLRDTSILVETATTSGDAEEVAHALHTIKGGSMLLGIRGLGGLCHELEEELAAEKSPLGPSAAQRLTSRWSRLRQLGESASSAREARLELSQYEYAALLEDIEAGSPHEKLRARVVNWQREGTHNRLTALASHCHRIAEAQEKELRVDIHSAEVALDDAQWAPLWSTLPHAISNAIVHGIEEPHVRLRNGKGRQGMVSIASRIDTTGLVLEIRDDGAGIDWNAIRDKAQRRGLPCETEADLVDALFAEGLSSRDDVGLYAGRGIGMAALKAAVERLSGTIAVTSRANVGTTMTFAFPLDSLPREARAESVVPRRDSYQPRA